MLYQTAGIKTINNCKTTNLFDISFDFIYIAPKKCRQRA